MDVHKIIRKSCATVKQHQRRDLTGQTKKGAESFSGQDFQRTKLAMQMLKVIEKVAAM